MATSSPMNRPFAEMPRYAPLPFKPAVEGSIANAPTRDIGRSGTDAGRLNEQAIRQLKSQGKVVEAAQLANSNEWRQLRARGPIGLPELPMRAPGMPGMPNTEQPGRVSSTLPFPAPGVRLPAMNLPELPSSGRGFSGLPELPELPGSPSTGGSSAANVDGLPELPASEPAAPEMPRTFEEAFNASPLAGAGLPPMNQSMPPMMLPSNTPPELMNQLNQGSFAGAYATMPAPAGVQPLPGTAHGMVMKNGQPTGSIVPFTPPPANNAEIDAFQKSADAAGFHALNVPGQGWQLKPKDAPAAKTVMAYDASGNLREFPEDYELPPGWQPMKRKPAAAPAPKPGAATPAPAYNPFGSSAPAKAGPAPAPAANAPAAPVKPNASAFTPRWTIGRM